MEKTTIDWPAKYLGRADCNAVNKLLDRTPDYRWQENKFRQIVYANVHAETQSIILILYDGIWPDVKIYRRNGWNYFGDQVFAVMKSILFAHYAPGGTIIRAMLARLPAGAKILRHIDTDPSFAASHRIHVPLRTNQAVEFTVGETLITTEVGLAFELNNAMPHMVVNAGKTDRVHLIFDYMPKPMGVSDAFKPEL